MRLIAFALALVVTSAVSAGQQPVYGPRLEGFDYPYAVHQYRFVSQRQALEMAYMDVAPTGKANGKVAVLLHGKNFCAATWATTIAALSTAGYRVIAPDQIGFCKSSKPSRYQFTLGQLAANTRALLADIGVGKSVVVGHSMGGMLAMRYALMYPDATTRLGLVDPIGLEDWRALGVPWRSVDAWYRKELETRFESIRKYQMDVYYAGTWKPAFRTLGTDAGGHVRRIGQGAGGVGSGADLRHGVQRTCGA